MRNGDVLQGNANLSWELGKYSISAYARNFTNQRYKTYINLQSSTDGTANEAVLSDPRTFGVVASARF
jgi:iron complex outermembrane receptor protein